MRFIWLYGKRENYTLLNGLLGGFFFGTFKEECLRVRDYGGGV